MSGAPLPMKQLVALHRSLVPAAEPPLSERMRVVQNATDALNRASAQLAREAVATRALMLLARLGVSRSAAHISPDVILRLIAQIGGVTVADLRGRRRTQDVACLRQLAMYCCRVLIPRMSYPAIGRIFRRDHTTVIHATRVIEHQVSLRPVIDALQRALGHEPARKESV
jgi:chromosomal replication initiator protein